MRKAFVLFFVSILVTVVACTGSRGDECDEEGRVKGECDEGLVCGNTKADGSGELQCLRQCDTQLTCDDGEECGYVGKTSLKGCRPR